MVVPAVMLVGGVWKLSCEAVAGLTVIVAEACVYPLWVVSAAATVYEAATVDRVIVWKVATPATAVPGGRAGGPTDGDVVSRTGARGHVRVAEGVLHPDHQGGDGGPGGDAGRWVGGRPACRRRPPSRPLSLWPSRMWCGLCPWL